MCDTLAARGTATSDGSTLFAKNSDREPDEVQDLEVIEAADHAPGETVTCTWITIPQAPRTARVLLSRPFWMFGAEMGANHSGVVIGNEALFTKEKPDRAGLTGMDLLRLALERADTAAKARDVIIALLEAHGQGGNCGYRLKADYMNGFLIADADEIYVLETVKRWWAWKKIEDLWTISNIISLTDDFDACSPGLIENAVSRGWAKSASAFNFRAAYSDRLITRGARSAGRESCSRRSLEDKNGRLTTRDLMESLRDHGGDPRWRPDRQTRPAVCMHAKDPLFGRSQTTGSLVAKLGRDRKYFYATGASTPCLSPFFPVFAPNTAMPAGYVPGTADYDPASYWWESERRHRRALSRFGGARRRLEPRLKDFEERMIKETENQSGPLSQDLIDRYFEEARELTREMDAGLDGLAGERTGPVHRLYWSWYNRRNRIP